MKHILSLFIISLFISPARAQNDTLVINHPRRVTVISSDSLQRVIVNGKQGDDNFVYQNGDEIIVNGEGELQVFDVLGRFVMSQNVSGVERISKPAQTGVYIFMMNGNAQKIVVK